MADKRSSPPPEVIGDNPLVFKADDLQQEKFGCGDGEAILSGFQNSDKFDSAANLLDDQKDDLSYLEDHKIKAEPKVTPIRQKKEVPYAGQYAIEHSKGPPPDLEIPPECFLYDEDRPWVLGKLNPASLSLPEPAEPVPLPKNVLDHLDILEAAANAAINAKAEATRQESS